MNQLSKCTWGVLLLTVVSNAQQPTSLWGAVEQRGVVYRLDALGVSPFEGQQDPNQGAVASPQQVIDRIGIVAPFTRRVRTFGVAGGLAIAGSAAHTFGLEAAIGAWLGPVQASNAAEITTLVQIGLAGEAEILIVGSETVLRGDLTPAQLITYIQQVRGAVPGIPVTTAETYRVWLEHPELVDAVDLLFVNYYPYWEGVPIEDAVGQLACWHAEVVTAATGKEVVVSETGWPTAGDAVGQAVPSMTNAAFYFGAFVSWARRNNVEYYWFAAFDEPWKALYEGPQGAHWGLWDAQGHLKPAMRPVFAGLMLPPATAVAECLPNGSGIPSIALTLIPAVGSSADLEGTVLHVSPITHRVAVYIRVGGGWWTKPTFAEPVTAPAWDGQWITDITTGGNDPLASDVAAFLLPLGVSPAPANGQPFLPASIFADALAWVQAPKP